MNITLLCGAIFLVALLMIRSVKSRKGYGFSTSILLKKRQCYQQRPFLTDRERVFFRQLCAAFSGSPLLVMAQVRLVDVVQVCEGIGGRERLSLFRQISQWHCDYVVIDARDFSVKAIIELDDRSHLRPERQRRDALFNIVVAQAGIPLLRPRSVKQAGNVASRILNAV
jgi:hypothetical protein